MLPELKQRWTPDLLTEACARFELECGSVRDLGGFESFVFAARHRGRDVVLKISDSERMSVAGITAEVVFVRHLAAFGLGVANFIGSTQQTFVERLKRETGLFTATVQLQATGRRTQPGQAGPRLWRLIGATLGALHTASRSLAKVSRPTVMTAGRARLKFLPHDAPELVPRGEGILAAIKKMYQQGSPETGLIHGDLHHGNFYLDGDRLQVFDFDDCVYSCFVHDLAISLFYAVARDGGDPDDRAHTRSVVEHMCAGYREHAPLSDATLALVPTFVALRELEQFAVIIRSLAPEDYSDWCRRFMARRQQKIAAGVPFIALD